MSKVKGILVGDSVPRPADHHADSIGDAPEGPLPEDEIRRLRVRVLQTLDAPQFKKLPDRILKQLVR